MPAPRRFLFPAAAVLLGTALALVAGEVLLRAAWPQRSAVTLGMFRDDPHAGYSLQPGYENFVRVPEYTTTIRIDGEGYRVPESGARDDAPRRILAIGDSFTFGVGVEAEEAWPEVLERELGPGAAVRNGGVGGYGPLRSAKLLAGRQAAWDPQVIVHALYVGNDLEDCRPETYRELPRIRDGRMVPDVRNPLVRARFWMRVHSHLYAFLRDQLYDLYQRTPLPRTGRYLDPIGLREWPVEIREETWPAAQDALRETAAIARERGARYLVVVIPQKYQVRDDAWRIYRERQGLPDDAFDRAGAQREIARFLAAEGIAALDLLPHFLAHAERETLYFPVDAHWTAAGHRAAATAVRRELARRGWDAGTETGAAPVASAGTAPTG